MSAGPPPIEPSAGRTEAAPPGRARVLLLGALLGAIAVLLAYPASRPFYIGTLVPSALDRALKETAAVAKGNQLSDARTQSGRAMWFIVAASRIAKHRPISARELQTVEGLMRVGADAEPQNAFWDQADGTLLARAGRIDAAAGAWLRGTKKLTWNDHENDFLSGALAGRDDVPAYAYAELYELRTPYDDPRQPSDLGAASASQLIYSGAQALLGATWDVHNLSVRIRLATVLNGTLMRQHARSIATTRDGIKIIEAAVSKPTDEPEASLHPVKGLAIARGNFTHAVVRANLGYDGEAIDRLFREADAAYAFTTIEDVRRTMQLESAEAAILHTAPGALLLCTLLGGAVIGARRLLGRFYRAQKRTLWPGTAAAAALAVIVALFVTSVYAAFALGLCIVFAGITPAHVRKRRPEWLGPLFWVMTSAVATVFLFAAACGFVLSAEPSKVLLVPKLPAAFDGQAAVCGVVALAVGFLFLCAPLWAFAQRLPTMHVLNVGFREFGQKLVLGSLILAVISGPTCVYLDRLLAVNRLDQQFRNEFLYYNQKISPTTSTQNDADPHP